MKQQKNALPIPTESQEQQALYRWINWKLPKYPELENLYHIPNEGKRSAYEGARMKREGLIPGMPDLCLPVPRGKFSALYIELKRKNGKLSKAQDERLTKLNQLGNCTAVCYGWEEAAKVIEWYVTLKKEEA